MNKVKPLRFYTTNSMSQGVLFDGKSVNQNYLRKRLEEEFWPHASLVESFPDNIGQRINKLIVQSKGKPDSKEYLTNRIRNEISGIICPLSIVDNYDLAHIRLFSVSEKEKDSIQWNMDANCLDRPAVKNFFEKYLGGIPVFESYIFVPGYRNEPMQIGERIRPEDFIPLIKSAYDIWINKNKETWLAEIERRKNKE